MGNNNWEDDDGWENEDDIYSGTEMIRPDDDEDIFDMTERLMKEKKELLKQRDLLLEGNRIMRDKLLELIHTYGELRFDEGIVWTKNGQDEAHSISRAIVLFNEAEDVYTEIVDLLDELGGAVEGDTNDN